MSKDNHSQAQGPAPEKKEESPPSGKLGEKPPEWLDKFVWLLKNPLFLGAFVLGYIIVRLTGHDPLCPVLEEVGIRCEVSTNIPSVTTARIFVLDSYERIYDRNGETNHVTNGHDIRDNLRPDGNPEILLENIFQGWESEPYIYQKKPKLIIVHFSSFLGTNEFDETLTPKNLSRCAGLKRMVDFLGDVATDTDAQILVYSRRWVTTRDAIQELSLIPNYNVLVSKGRLHCLPLGNVSGVTFRDGDGLRLLRKEVNHILDNVQHKAPEECVVP